MDICINVSTGPPTASDIKKVRSRLNPHKSAGKKTSLNGNNNSGGSKVRQKYLPTRLQKPGVSPKPCTKLVHPDSADKSAPINNKSATITDKPTKTNDKSVDDNPDVPDTRPKHVNMSTNTPKFSDSGKVNNFKSNPHKSAGKISSLFGNNPDVPNIGQRLVKPVSELVFTKKNFDDLGIHPHMISNLRQNMEITTMTTVQQKAIPQILSGKDILVRSQTGSGKTLTYALPIVEFLHKVRPKLLRDSGLKALVIVPTRELALQTYECFLKLVKSFTWIVPGYINGGEKRKAEKARLRRGCTILVATPGRLLDHIKHTEALKLKDVKYFVLDEADRMLDMGYEKDISEIVSALENADGSSSVSSNGYDPMLMLRQNKKTVFNDEEEKEEKEEKIDVKDIEVEEDKTSEIDEQKQEYHSGTDSDDEKQKLPMRNKKLIKKTSQVVEEEKVKAESSEATKETSVRQTILLSATLTNAVEKLAGLTMTNPIFVDAAEDNLKNVGGSLGDINEDLVVPQSVIQSYVVTPPKLRMVTLSAFIAGKCQVIFVELFFT